MTAGPPAGWDEPPDIDPDRPLVYTYPGPVERHPVTPATRPTTIPDRPRGYLAACAALRLAEDRGRPPWTDDAFALVGAWHLTDQGERAHRWDALLDAMSPDERRALTRDPDRWPEPQRAI